MHRSIDTFDTLTIQSTALLLIAGLLVFPLGWDHPVIREVCGPSSDMYSPGDCSVRWTLILAVIGAVDVCVLSLLSFLLGSRYVKLLEPKYVNHRVPIGAGSSSPSSSLIGSKTGHVNGAFGTPPPLTTLGGVDGISGGKSRKNSGSSGMMMQL